MRKTMRVVLGAVIVVGAGLIAHASDRVAVYAKVDKVVFEPNEQAPERVQVWGVFSVADWRNNNMNDYQPTARGYLYFTLGKNPEIARREWTDLKSVAGTNQIVAFGLR